MPLLNVFPHVTLTLHHATATSAAFLEFAWQPGVTASELRQAVLRALAVSAEFGVRGWFCNAELLHEAPGFGPQIPLDELTRELDWIAQAILVPLGRVGLRRLAQRAAPDAPTRQAIDATYASLRGQLPYEVRYFEHPEAARAWLTDETRD